MRTRIFLLSVALCITGIAAGAAAGADDSFDKLYSAIRANDLRQIKALLDGGVRASAEGPDGITPLMDAAEIGSSDAMKMLHRSRRRRQRAKPIGIDRSDVVRHRREEGSSAARSWRRCQRGRAQRTNGSDRCVVCESVGGGRAYAPRQGRERGRHGPAESHAD